MTKIATIWSRLLSGVGFSNGCAERPDPSGASAPACAGSPSPAGLVVLDGLAVGAELGGLVVLGFDGLEGLVAVEVLDHALLDEDDREDEGQRQQQPQGAARHVGPEVADMAGQTRGEAADQREQHGDAGGGRDEVLHRQRQHLRQVAHRRFAAVALPVGVGHEADGSVEGRVGRTRWPSPPVERQHALQALQGVDGDDADEVEDQQADGVLLPAHPLFGLDAAETEDRFLDGGDPARDAALREGGDPAGKRPGEQQRDAEIKGQIDPGEVRHVRTPRRARARSGDRRTGPRRAGRSTSRARSLLAPQAITGDCQTDRDEEQDDAQSKKECIHF
ncbi:hypothetical protein Ddc_23681 [Ditylenchus destructor]|nr:hypothetical protein Ddc_23681 [Ditylenchus destructor]